MSSLWVLVIMLLDMQPVVLSLKRNKNIKVHWTTLFDCTPSCSSIAPNHCYVLLAASLP